jgi:O-antigen ligase
MDCNKTKSDIITGVLIPITLAILAVIGSVFALEIFTIPASILLVVISLWATTSIKPFLFLVVTISYHLPAVHLYPSDYYTIGWHPYVLLGSILLLLVSLVYYIVKNQLFAHAPIKKIPLVLPLAIMTAGMLLNGVLAPDYKIMNLVWSSLMMMVYFFVYVVVYLAIKRENPRDMVQYFNLLTLLTSWILIVHMVKIYFVDGVIVDGVLDRNRIVMGYGVCTLMGFHITTLIPVNFYGFMKGKTPVLSLVTAILIWISGIATTSRNAALIGTVYFIVCFVFSAFYGRRVVAGRVILAVAGGVIVGIFLFFGYHYIYPEHINNELVRFVVDNVRILITQYINRGLNSSGRTDIWKRCFDLFMENPIFGKGFFGVRVSEQIVPAEYIPEFAHNTIFELIAATGIVGALCYGCYRLATLKVMFHRFDLDRFMILVGASVMVAESLLDNYAFQIYTTFYYVIALAIAARLFETRRGADYRLDTLDSEV